MKQKPNANSKGKKSRPKIKLGIPDLEMSKAAVYAVLARRIRGGGTSMRSMSLSLGIAPSRDSPLTKTLSCGTESTSRSGALHPGPSMYAWRP